MSRNLGQVYLAHNNQGGFLIPNQEGGGDYSAMTAHLIDKDIRKIIDEQYDRSLEILNANREILNQTAKTLLESEVIEGAELQALASAISKQTADNDRATNRDDLQPLAA